MKASQKSFKVLTSSMAVRAARRSAAILDRFAAPAPLLTKTRRPGALASSSSGSKASVRRMAPKRLVPRVTPAAGNQGRS